MSITAQDVVSDIAGASVLKRGVRAIPIDLCMFIVVLLIAFVSAILTSLLPDIYK